jgi:hypothetical protein
LRKVLLSRGGRLYIGWESCRVEDFTTAVCCTRCSMYGHNSKKCRQERPTCADCGGDHEVEACKAAEKRCATCHRFGQKGAEKHRTGARDCPARINAERRMVESTAY